MALVTKRPFVDTLLDLKSDEDGVVLQNHILEPEYHQDLYRLACENAKASSGAFQLGDTARVQRAPNRGRQPDYVDDETDPETLKFQGMLDHYGHIVDGSQTTNVCALKSVSVRWGYVDFGVARAVSKDFFDKHKDKCGVRKHDLLINSTGDGTIGRVAIYNKEFPALVDGHITIVRFKQPHYAWYAAAYLLSEQGQRQIYRYINGSSGQVEIYPQDISRLWIPAKTEPVVKEIAKKFQKAISKYEEFEVEMTSMLAMA
ncbi:hypothetical protein [Frateuria terrea]|uniref:Type I restriction enzyme M protein n=1 Tax=Frateuria terrea TaxID=529704 RepID=A0A1H6VXR0_9GAMM|nr:hypothetical protein [Frateuria terrea]SEJ05400.1 type I restriction enzyme M protein [Frateuria terrea]SFP62750.1 type I restriction enzyme M protein [Frateuria terrea]